ncbi:MAG: hypothetical protein M3003_00710 [Candidatus Dormibacteraeota bacterium]|nr:hypothetical protein [Candidatus Dormibacteraeota bacterium]
MSKVAQHKLASLLIRGSEKTLDVVAVDREEDLDLIVSIPKEGPGALGLRIETTSRLSIGPFGKWLVIDAIAPSARFRHDSRASYIFGHFDSVKKAFEGRVFVVPSSLIGAVPGVKGRSPRISFRARLDGVNQEWCDFAFAPDQLGTHLLELLRDPESGLQAA